MPMVVGVTVCPLAATIVDAEMLSRLWNLIKVSCVSLPSPDLRSLAAETAPTTPANRTRLIGRETGSNILTLRLPDVARKLENYFATAVLAERRPAGPISSTRLLVGAEGPRTPTFAL